MMFKERIVAFMAYVVGVLGVIIIPLNVLFTYKISKKYKEKSTFVYKHAIQAANINASIIIHSIVLMLMFAVFGLYFRHQGISIDHITTDLAVIYILVYYFLQILIAMIYALLGKSLKIIVWPKLFEEEKKSGHNS